MDSQTEPSKYVLLKQITSPTDLDSLTSAQTVTLASEIREFLIESVAKTGGHLGPNLGVVELSIALHRVYDSPHDILIWDTGHQAYAHKLLTGRQDFSTLRQPGGLSGYPSREESIHDVVENSHASTALSWADGVSRQRFRCNLDGTVVAVIGDGALTGGMAWEALNNIAEDQDRRLVIVVNDNGRSYEPTIGGMARHLAGLRTSENYERTLAWGKRKLLGLGEPGRAAYEALHGVKTGLKDMFAPQILFEDLGLKYIGPIDGHDVISVEYALEKAKGFGRPVIVHVITEKGRGYTPAEEDISDRFHAVGKIHPETGLPIAPQRFGWTAVFAEEIVNLAQKDSSIVGITAAMKAPVGLQPLADLFPGRVIDIGIAEQHGMTMAAGMAFSGAHPIFAMYATFMNRAFDQLLMDVSLHKAPVTVVLDRAGITGDDGASHNGMWDLSLGAMVPGLKICAPRDADSLKRGLEKAVSIKDGPTLIRYPKGEVSQPLPAIRTECEMAVLRENSQATVLLIGVGPLACQAVEAAEQLAKEGIGVDVIDPEWVFPITENLLKKASKYDLVVTAEDGLTTGGFGSELQRRLSEWNCDQTRNPATSGWLEDSARETSQKRTSVRVLGIPTAFLKQGRRPEIMKQIGLDTAGIKNAVQSFF